ncbi:MAG: hypothetical protein QOG41_98, partial [Thermoleophilaceae bacterium]|nr:hypothetical protein [Thermoleophilaceae bacterium]
MGREECGAVNDFKDAITFIG